MTGFVFKTTTPSKRPTTPTTTTPKKHEEICETATPLPAGDSRLPWRRCGVHPRRVYRRSRVTHAYIAPPRNRHVADTRAAAVVSAGAVCVVGLHAIDCARASRLKRQQIATARVVHLRGAHHSEITTAMLLSHNTIIHLYNHKSSTTTVNIYKIYRKTLPRKVI